MKAFIVFILISLVAGIDMLSIGGIFRKFPGTSTSSTSGCPFGLPKVNCFISPCKMPGSGCSKIPNAVCKANYCGMCKAEWSVAGKRIKC